jgi:hypothetical protein
MSTLVRRSTLAVAVCSVALVSVARAQVKIELGATMGLYSPLGSFQPAQIHSTSLPDSPGSLGGAAYGAQLRLWVAPRLGFELAGAMASSTFGGGATPGGRGSSFTSARVSTGTAELLFRVTGDESRARVWLGAGAGAVQHGGDAYANFGNPVNYGGVLGVGSAIRISGGLSADVGVSSMIYNLNIRGNASNDPGLSERGTQVDMLLRTGLSYSWH